MTIHFQLEAASIKVKGLTDLQKSAGSLAKLINKLTRDIHTNIYVDIFFLTPNTSEISSQCH